MNNSFIMTESIVRPAKMPYGRLRDNGFIGIEGEHAARALVVETKDDLSAFVSINLIIDDLDCGAMTKTTSGSTATLSKVLTSSMIGRSGKKICQLIMVNSDNTVVQKSSQFEAYVGRANEIERSVDDGVTIIILSEAVTEMAREAVAAASITVDDTLTQTGQAADAAETGRQIGLVKADLEDLDDRVEALEEGSSGGSGLTDDVKTALMNLVNHLAWDDDDPTGQTYITALYNALYPPAPPASLTGITAVYTQSGTVYDTDSLNDLKSDLVVTAHYSDSTTGIVTGYTLSGTLAAGTSTITVAYSGKTTTFNVTVTEYSDVPSEYTWLYQSSSGTVLSADTTNIYNVLSQGTITEEISNGFLHVNLGSASNNYYQYELLPRTTTNAVLTVKAKCNALANFQNNLTGMRLLLSNGTAGANLAIDRTKIRYGEGSTVMAVDYPTGFDYTDWHIYKLELTSNGHQIGYIDGVQIFDSTTLSTAYSVENRLAFIQSIGTYPTDVDIEWVAYLDRSAA